MTETLYDSKGAEKREEVVKKGWMEQKGKEKVGIGGNGIKGVEGEEKRNKGKDLNQLGKIARCMQPEITFSSVYM